MSAAAAPPDVVAGRAVGLSELTPHLVCPLCGGYYVDATAIVECLHTFCRSCIVRHLRKTRRCPTKGCDVLVQKAQGASAANLRPDNTLQSIVYKTVPGLYRAEMQRRRLFYADKMDSAAVTPSELEELEEDNGVHFYDANDTIDVRIQYWLQRLEDVVHARYLRCPAGLPLSVLRKFLRTKYRLSENLQMELLHESRRLPNDVKLLDVAYMVNWDRTSPLELFFMVLEPKPASKRSTDTLPQACARPSKVRRMSYTDTSDTLREGAKETAASHKETATPAATKTVPTSSDKHVEKTNPRQANTSHSSSAIKATKAQGLDVGVKQKGPATPTATKAVPTSSDKQHVEKVNSKRTMSNDSRSAMKSSKPLDPDAGKKSGDVGTKSNQKSRNDVSKTASVPNSTSVKRKPSSNVDGERFEKKRKKETVGSTNDSNSDKAFASKSAKDSSMTLADRYRDVKSSMKPQSGSSNTTREKTTSSGGVAGYTGKEDTRSQGKKPEMKSATSRLGLGAEKVGNVLPSGNERLERQHGVANKESGKVPQDNNGNTLKPKDKEPKDRPQKNLEKETSKHHVYKTKEHPAKLNTGTAVSTYKSQELEKDALFKQLSLVKVHPSKHAKSPAATSKSMPDLSEYLPALGDGKTSVKSSMVANQPQKKSKTTTLGTNTLLSSSPQITKAQTKSSNSPVRNESKLTGTKLCDSPATPVRTASSERSSNHSQVPGSSEGHKPASKTIFLFSGMKQQPQNSNRIMSIVESLAQRSMLAKKEGTATTTSQSAKSISTNGTSASTSTATSRPPSVTVSGTFVAPSPVPVRSAAVTPVRPVSSPLHIETGSLDLRYGSSLSGLSRPKPSGTTTSTFSSSRPVFPVPPLPQRPKSHSVHNIPNPSLLRQRSAEERARDCGKGSPTAGSTAPSMSSPSIKDIHSLTRQLQEAGTSVTITNTT